MLVYSFAPGHSAFALIIIKQVITAKEVMHIWLQNKAPNLSQKNNLNTKTDFRFY